MNFFNQKIITIFAVEFLNECKNMEKRKIRNRIEYIVTCIGAFAQCYGLSNPQAYAYLRRYSGIDFLFDCYEAEHTLSIDDAVEDLQAICFREGGKIA